MHTGTPNEQEPRCIDGTSAMVARFSSLVSRLYNDYPLYLAIQLLSIQSKSAIPSPVICQDYTAVSRSGYSRAESS